MGSRAAVDNRVAAVGSQAAAVGSRAAVLGSWDTVEGSQVAVGLGSRVAVGLGRMFLGRQCLKHWVDLEEQMQHT